MQYSSIPYSEIDLGNRIDAEYFQPVYLHIEEKLLSNNSVPIRKYCSLTASAFYPAATHLYEIGDLPFIRCVDCTQYPVITSRQKNTFEKIPTSFANDYKNIKRLSQGEIVITKVGTPCYASIIHDLDDVALSRTVLGLKSIKNIDPYYLIAFLRSKYGFLQLFRERELTIQFQLTLDRVGNILVFKPENEDLEKLIANCFFLYEETTKKSTELFEQAQTILLSELNLTHWQPKHQLTFIKNYSDAVEAGRIDAEYYQPKYDEIINAIKNYSGGWETLDSLVHIKKCIEVGSGEYLDEGVPFVRVSNISPFEITEEKYISEALYSELAPEEKEVSFIKSKKHQPQQGEILFSKDGTPGIAHYLKAQPAKMIPSSGILRLKSKTDKINDEYLTLVLNSVLTQEQVNRDVGGSIILHWRPDQVKQTVIPVLSNAKQLEIQQNITESFKLRKQSKHLLECAKKAVEMAIEQNEQTAIKWLENETKEMQI